MNRIMSFVKEKILQDCFGLKGQDIKGRRDAVLKGYLDMMLAGILEEAAKQAEAEVFKCNHDMIVCRCSVRIDVARELRALKEHAWDR